MKERLRFTGNNPPITLSESIPNWQNAYEEETLPDQDETTLRPADTQLAIDDDVSLTVGEVVFANGQRVPASLEVLCDEVSSVYPEPQKDECWIMSFNVPANRWEAWNCDWSSPGVIRAPTEVPGLFPL